MLKTALFNEFNENFLKNKTVLLNKSKNWYIMELIKSHEMKGENDNECRIIEILYWVKGDEFNSICNITWGQSKFYLR